MNDKPITHDVEPRAYRLCQCHECGTVALCTPGFDFYTWSIDDLNGEPLQCEMCFRRELAARGVKTNLLPPMGAVA